MELWTQVLHSIKVMPINGVLLKALTDLILAGLNSTHRPIVNSTIELWNKSFGQLNELEYPERLVPALSKLHTMVELELPSFPIAMEHNESQIQLSFDDAEEDKLQEDNETTPRAYRQHTPLFPKPGFSLAARLGSAEPTAQLTATPTSNRRAAQKLTPKARLRHEDSQIDFVPVESSPAADQDGESQNLTEHQREVLQRQQFETAQMYPNFSSSPVKSTADRENVSRLDFGQPKTVLARPSTPEPTHNQARMDDFLGSSPTPRTAEKQHPFTNATSSTEGAFADEVVDDTDVEIPSSPPEIDDEDNESEYGENILQEEADQPLPTTLIDTIEDAGIAVEEHDGATPTAVTALQDQQMLAEKAMENAKESVVEAEQSDDFVNAPTEVANLSPGQGDAENDSASRDSTPIHFSESLEQASLPVRSSNDLSEAPTREEAGKDQEVAEENNDRVEDSFAVTSSNSTPRRQTPARAVKTNDNSQTAPETRSGSRKRKSEADSAPASSSKKRKRSSPVKRLLPVWLGGSQSGDDAPEEEYIEDCIVVASQPQPEPAAMLSQPEAETERSASQPVADAADKPVKTRRGRPRKSFTPVSETPAAAAPLSRGRKRRSLVEDTSSVDMASQEDDEIIHVIETPAPPPRKTRRTRKSQDVSEAERVEDSIVPATRQVNRVILPVVDLNKEDYVQYTSDTEEQNSPEKQLRKETVAAASQTSQPSRTILKPKSIMSTLWGVLEACKRMVSLPLQQEREITEMLFEIRSEVMAASRRGESSRGS